MKKKTRPTPQVFLASLGTSIHPRDTRETLCGTLGKDISSPVTRRQAECGVVVISEVLSQCYRCHTHTHVSSTSALQDVSHRNEDIFLPECTSSTLMMSYSGIRSLQTTGYV